MEFEAMLHIMRVYCILIVRKYARNYFAKVMRKCETTDNKMTLICKWCWSTETSLLG